MKCPFEHLTITEAEKIRDAALKRQKIPVDRGPHAFGTNLMSPPSAEKVELLDLIGALSKEAFIELAALMIFGRDSRKASMSTWKRLVADERTIYNSSEGDRSRVYGKSPLGNYLVKGLKLIEQLSHA